MTEPEIEIDLMDVDRSERLRHAFHDADGTDWRLEPHDDEAVTDALDPDPAGSDSAGSDSAGTDSAGSDSAGSDSAGTDSAGTDSES